MKTIKKLWAFLSFFACFLLVSCNLPIQKEVGIRTISVDYSLVPEEGIVIGEFDQAGIQLLLTYEDDSTAQVPVTSAMIPEEYQYCLQTSGYYSFDILFRNNTINLSFIMIDPYDEFTVRFFAGLSHENLLSTQLVKKGYSAVAPLIGFEVTGKTFMGWDKDFENISQDLDVFAEYATFFDVTFFNGHLELIKTFRVLEGTTSPEPTESERMMPNYNFVCWDRSFVNITGNISVYGIYISSISSSSNDAIDFTFSEGNYYVTGYEADAPTVNIPEFFNDGINGIHDVVGVAENAFMDHSIRYVSLPKTIRSIGKNAFLNSRLEHIEIADESQLETIGESALRNTLLSDITFPSSLRTIERYAFVGNNLKEVRFNKGLISVGVDCFYSIYLEYVYISSTIQTFYSTGIERCPNLKDIEISYLNPFFVIENNCLVDRSTGTLLTYPNKNGESEMVIPKEINFIGNFVFFGNKTLTSVTFEEGSQIRGIGQQAFAATSLISIDLPGSLCFLDANIFEFCNNLTSAIIRKNNPDIFVYVTGNSIFRGCINLESIEVEPGHFALYSHDGLLYNSDGSLNTYPAGKKDSEYYFDESTTYILRHALDEAKFLEKISFSDNFDGFDISSLLSDSLKEINLPKNLTVLGNDVLPSFSGPERHMKVEIHSALKRIQMSNFNMNGTYEIIYHGTPESWERIFIDESNFKSCSYSFVYCDPDADLSIVSHGAGDSSFGYSYFGYSTPEGELYRAIDRSLDNFDSSQANMMTPRIASIRTSVLSACIPVDRVIAVANIYAMCNPSHFYLKNAFSYGSNVEGDNLNLYCGGEYFSFLSRQEALGQIENMLLEVGSRIDLSDKSDFSISKIVHDYIIEQIDYKGNVFEDTWSVNIGGVASGQGAICQGYSKTYSFLCNYFGVESIVVTNDAINHMYNMTNIDGTYYWTDVTWDDRGELGTAYDYFLKGSDTFLLEHANSNNSSMSGISFLYDLPLVSNLDFPYPG